MSRFVENTLSKARTVVEESDMSTVNKALYLQWLAGLVSGYGLVKDAPGVLTECREAADEIKAMSDELMGFEKP